MEITRSLLDELLSSREYICIVTREITKDPPKSRKLKDLISCKDVFDLVFGGDLYPGKYAKVFGKTPESFTALMRRYASAYNIKDFNISEIYREDIRSNIKSTMKSRCGVEHIWQRGKLREALESKWLEKYGVDNPLSAKEVQSKISKTNLERYGVDKPFKSPEIQNKVVTTNLLRYGVHTTLLIPEFKTKRFKTLLSLYEDIHSTRTLDIKDKVKTTRQSNGVRYDKLIRLYEGNLEYSECAAVDFIISSYKDTAANAHLKALGLKTETEFSTEVDIKSMLTNWGIDFVHNAMKIHGVKKNRGYYELDVYIPELKLGIEINGLQNHSVNAKAMGRGKPKSKDYHFKKFKKFHDSGILMLSFTDYEQKFFREDYCNIIKFHLKLTDEIKVSDEFFRVQ